MKKTTPDSTEDALADLPADDLDVLRTDEVEVATDMNATNNAAENATSDADAKSNNSVALQAALDELTSDLQRTRADFENYRKQVESQRTQAMSSAKSATALKFLPLLDDFERALETYPEQLTPLRKSFDKTLQTLGLTKINSEPGTEFNPDFHEAVSVVGDASGDVELISETLRPGYLYDGSVIRAAMVKVDHQ